MFDIVLSIVLRAEHVHVRKTDLCVVLVTLIVAKNGKAKISELGSLSPPPPTVLGTEPARCVRSGCQCVDSPAWFTVDLTNSRHRKFGNGYKCKFQLRVVPFYESNFV